ncbi:MAG: hypothetical protein SR2Q5_08885 [Quinella sp. 2Q5]|nr:hypothetical protein [Quinella sp. 2Q5]
MVSFNANLVNSSIIKITSKAFVGVLHEAAFCITCFFHSSTDNQLYQAAVRPLTDQVFVYPPTDAVQAAAIDEAAQSAVTAYVDWQRAKLGNADNVKADI